MKKARVRAKTAKLALLEVPGATVVVQMLALARRVQLASLSRILGCGIRSAVIV
jgi:hypothetical protein